MMTIGDREGHIFFPTLILMMDDFFILLATKYLILSFKYMKKLPENPEFAKKRHGDDI